MANIGVFVERYTISRTEEMGALMRLGQVAQRLGHRLDVLFRPDMYKIPQYDALLIRALTDPLNSAYVASRLAHLHGLRVIDDPDSIVICCDKVNMYRHLMQANVPMPETVFLNEPEVTLERAEALLQSLGDPLVLKAPNSSFSRYVEKASTAQEFVRVSKRFFRRADRLVVQKFVRSSFDWRVGLLGGEPLYVCRYTIPKKSWKIVTYTESEGVVYGRVQGFDLDRVPPGLLDTAKEAGAAIGNGLYGVDLKQDGDDFYVIEVNDNPTIERGEEDQRAPQVYEHIIRYLAGGKTPA
ncbi:MAG: RimK family alpha-L-glutamate ligase [bacterium]|nr:RimK family alpha-L-glutamate ligase [bacterium]